MNVGLLDKKTPIPQTHKSKVVISGIGTGGHYFPAIVVAQELVRHDVEVILIVRKGYFEEEVVRMYGLKTFAINSQAFYGKPLFNKIVSIFSLIYSLNLLKRVTRGVIGVAFGGFGALPLILSCFINRSPFYLFEPNRMPGRVTKLFAARAKMVFVGLPLVISLKGDMVVTGIPIRQGFKSLSQPNRTKGRLQKKILFLGGSQGARRLNSLALEVQKILPREYHIVIISGTRDYDWVWNNRNDRTTVIPFTFSPWDEIQDADVVVSRSGALCGYEILSSQRPAIFIPFPFALDNHQYYNAQYFAEIGKSVVIEERDLTKEMLAEMIERTATTKVEKKSEIILDAERRITDIILRELIVKDSQSEALIPHIRSSSCLPLKEGEAASGEFDFCVPE